MSFALPNNVPSFTSSQRAYEDGYWGSSGRIHGHQNGHTGNGIAEKIGGFLDRRELPMYKDKPYSYAASRKQGYLYRRKRVIAGGLLFAAGLLYWLGLFSTAQNIPEDVKKSGKNAWAWLSGPNAAVVDWSARRERVKEAFMLSWDGYEQYAWGKSDHGQKASCSYLATTFSEGVVCEAIADCLHHRLRRVSSHLQNWPTDGTPRHGLDHCRCA